jgi:hypothetical protein
VCMHVRMCVCICVCEREDGLLNFAMQRFCCVSFYDVRLLRLLG